MKNGHSAVVVREGKWHMATIPEVPEATLAPALRAQDVARGELDFGCGVLRFR